MYLKGSFRLLCLTLFAAACLLLAQPVVVPPGGAPPPGTGPFDVSGFVRVIEGDTVQVYIRRNQVLVGFIGIRAPQGNTPCGEQAARFLQSLVSGGIRLEEDPGISFDQRKRKMYYGRKQGQSIALQMVTAGLARAAAEGVEAPGLAAAEAAARAAGRGCVFDPNANMPVLPPPAVGPKTAGRAAGIRAAVTADAGVAVNAAVAGAKPTNGFVVETFMGGFSFPTAFTWLPDGRILVAQKAGIVSVVKNGAVLAAPFIDLRAEVNAYSDHGLLGIAADPNFASNGYVYLLYTYENNAADFSGTKTARLTRVTASGDTAPLSSETTILGTSVGTSCANFPAGADCLPSDGDSHSIGNIKFAADGTMFLTAGDAASYNFVDDLALRSQNLDSLAGKLLHITTSGAGVPGNPFWSGAAGDNRSKVWALGFRNTYRFTLRPSDGMPFTGDVGWSTYEEVNVLPAGSNAGWPCYEGPYPQSGYQPKATCQALYSQGPGAVKLPLFYWDHAGGGAASTGGSFYTGTAFPPVLRGAYFFGDYAQGWIKTLSADASGNLTRGPVDFAAAVGSPVNIEQGADGNLYYIDIASGEIRRIRYDAATDAAPTVVNRSPAAGATGVLATTEVIAVFSEAVDPATLAINPSTKISSAFILVKQGSTTPVAATTAYDAGSATARLRPNVNLELGATYVATVKGGAGGVTDLTGNPLASDQVWSFTISPTQPANSIRYLSDMAWTSASNGYGPVERDTSNGESAAGDGHTIKLSNGQTYLKGLGVHANSDIRYNIAGGCSLFTAMVGIDAETGPNGSVFFQVLGDGVKLYDSGLQASYTAPASVSVNISAVRELGLVVVDDGDGFSYDHADWADARITCSSDTTPPTVSKTTPADAATGVDSNTAVTATFSEGMKAVSITTATFLLTPQGSTTPVPAAVQYDTGTLTATLTPSAALQLGTTYTAAVKGGSNGVADLAGNAMAVDKTWSFTTGSVATLNRYVSDMTWTSAVNGWGPVEKDTSNGEQAAGDGRTISLGSRTYTKGLGVHAYSEVHYNVNGGCTLFTSDVGVDDEVRPNGSVIFQVFADGIKLADSGLMTASTATKTLNVDITGKKDLALIVTDGGDGASSDHADWAGARVTCNAVSGKPVANITAPAPTLTWKVGDTVNYSGSGADGAGNPLPSSALSWNIITHHCPGGVCHTHPLTTSTGATGSFVASDHGDDVYFELILTATDSGGQTGTASVSIQPQTVQITLATSPPGLQVVYGGVSGTAPFTNTSIVGGVRTIYSPSPQGTSTFQSWSDAGAQQHNITVGAVNATYTAAFTTGTTGDTTPPTVTGVAPADAATGVSTATVVTATFSEPMAAASITASNFTLTAQGATTPVTATVAYDGATNTARLTPAAALAAGTVYTATVKGGSGGVSDVAGNVMTANRTWTFTTATPTAPAVTRVNPGAGATGVNPNVSPSATFSKAMNAATLTTATVFIVRSGTATPIPAGVSYSSTNLTVTVNPNSRLASGASYTVTIKGGTSGAKDTAGTPLASDMVWSFTTR